MLTLQTQPVKRIALLALPELLDGHAGEHCGQKIFDTLQFYSITGRLGRVCSDDASSMDTTCRKVSALLEEIDVEWNATTYRLRCLGHVL